MLSAVVASGCGATGPTIGACNAFSLPEAVHGTLRVAADGMGTASLEGPDGRRLTVTWPDGFAVRMTSEPALFDEAGRRVAGEGELIKMGTTLLGSAAGTLEDPYTPTACDLLYP
ncbi:MAG TPA: hypothetical protein VES19_02180 [Candidatus Limnocylindrales bacterium]|nr:hypothetical protein [Candidatus Limnocylindrales bacterium]